MGQDNLCFQGCQGDHDLLWTRAHIALLIPVVLLDPHYQVGLDVPCPLLVQGYLQKGGQEDQAPLEDLVDLGDHASLVSLVSRQCLLSAPVAQGSHHDPGCL